MSSSKANHRTRLSFAAAMVAGFLGGQAQAADEEPNPLAHRTVLTARVALPLLGGDDGRFTMIGVSLGQRFLNLIEIEAGVSEQWLIFESGPTFSVRAGLSPSVLTPRPSGTHWNLRIPLLAGFSYYNGYEPDDAGGPGHSSVWEVYHFDTGLDATCWGKSGVGFNIRILVNLGKARPQQTDGAPPYSGLVGGSLMFGVSFAGV